MIVNWGCFLSSRDTWVSFPCGAVWVGNLDLGFHMPGWWMVLNAWKAWVQTPESEVKGAGREPLGSSDGKASLTNGETEAQKVKDSSQVKKQSRQKNRSLLTQAWDHSSCDDHRNPWSWGIFWSCVWLCLHCGEAARSGDSHSLVASGNPWRWTALLLLLRGREDRGQTWKPGLWRGRLEVMK